jgi:hypothetical protein
MLPALFSRLLLAMWATLAGHLLDLIVVILALRLVTQPESSRRLLGLAGATLAALFTYISSLFNVGGFLGFLGLIEIKGRRGWRLLALAAGGAAVVVVCLYLPFALVFVDEILPAVLAGGGAKASQEASLAGALERIPLFFGYAYPLLTAAGLVVVRRQATRPAWRVVAAYGLTFALLVALRAFGGGLFKDLKEIEFVGPLVALGTGAVLAELARRGAWGRWAAGLTGLGLLAFGLGRYAEYLAPRTILVGLP